MQAAPRIEGYVDKAAADKAKKDMVDKVVAAGKAVQVDQKTLDSMFSADIVESFDGIEEAGIAVGVDASLPIASRIFMAKTAKAVASRALAVADPKWSKNMKVAFVKGAIIIIGRNLQGVNDQSHVVGEVLVCDVIQDCSKIPDVQEIFKLVFAQAGWNAAMCIILGSMINFYTMNHHSRQGKAKLTGYLAKVKSTFYAEESDEHFADVAWHLGHSVDFGTWLFSMKIPTKTTYSVKYAPIWPVMGEDVKLRLTSSPAGTAKIAVVLTIYRLLLGTSAKYLVPRPPELDQLLAASAFISAHPGQCAIWGRHFCPGDHVTFNVPSDMTLNNMACVAHTFLAGQTIAGAACLPKVERVQHLELYQTLKGLQKYQRQAYENLGAIMPDATIIFHPEGLPALKGAPVEEKEEKDSLDKGDWAKFSLSYVKRIGAQAESLARDSAKKYAATRMKGKAAATGEEEEEKEAPPQPAVPALPAAAQPAPAPAPAGVI